MCSKDYISYMQARRARMILSQYRWVCNLSARVDEAAQCLRRIFSVSRRYAAIWLTFSVGVKGRGHPKVNRALASPSEVSVDATWQSCLPMFLLTLSRCLIVSENDAHEDEWKQGKYSRLLLNKELVIFFYFTTSCSLQWHRYCSFSEKYPAHSLTCASDSTGDFTSRQVKLKWRSLINFIKSKLLLICEAVL